MMPSTPEVYPCDNCGEMQVPAVLEYVEAGCPACRNINQLPLSIFVDDE
jgi:phage FluMu protein Com